MESMDARDTFRDIGEPGTCNGTVTLTYNNQQLSHFQNKYTQVMLQPVSCRSRMVANTKAWEEYAHLQMLNVQKSKESKTADMYYT